MTPRMQVFYHVGIAFSFAITAVDNGFKSYKKSVGLLTKVLDELTKKLTQKQKEKVIRAVDKFAENNNMTAFDYMDHIAAAMEIIKHSRNKQDKKLNSWLALAATNVEEEIA